MRGNFHTWSAVTAVRHLSLYIYFFAFAVGLSIFFAEMAMGKISRLDTVGAFKSLATKGASSWKFAGIIMVTGLFIASFYTLIIGWVLKYVILSLSELPKISQVQRRFL